MEKSSSGPDEQRIWREGGYNGDATVQYCWFGESENAGGEVLRPDIKQRDGRTPRVCLVHEKGYCIRDANTHEEFTLPQNNEII